MQRMIAGATQCRAHGGPCLAVAIRKRKGLFGYAIAQPEVLEPKIRDVVF